jgi:nucleotide-binding universal stress UspA family protein
MFKSILLPTDGSPLSDKAAATAIQFAQLNGARIVAVTVIPPYPLMPTVADAGPVIDASVYDRQMQTTARHSLHAVEAAAQAAGVPFEGVVALSASPYDEIIETAKKYGCDIIVMASHGRSGLSKLFLGSETDKVLAHTALPVLVLH